jgi:type IV pilus assembly protein PilX
MALLSVMMILSVLGLMAMGAARFALWGERLSQGERDLAVSFEAAEAALLDAELDVMGRNTQSASAWASQRHCDFVAAEFLASKRTTSSVCGQGRAVGVCWDPAHPGQAWRKTLVWLRTERGTGAHNQTVAYGQFTGASWADVTQGGVVPATQVLPPRYVVEWAPLVGSDAGQARSGWVVTAVGFGLNPATQTWLQVVLDKPGPSVQTPCESTSQGRQSPWRYEVPATSTAMPNRWRCFAQEAAQDPGAKPPLPRVCGRLSWRELNVG